MEFYATRVEEHPLCARLTMASIFILEVEINKLRSEEAGLRDALLKMQALNEGLGQDKIELNRIIMSLEQDKATLQGDKQALENEKTGIREELLRVEQEKMEVETEKAGLNTTLDIAENNIEQLKTEIQYLSKEKAEVVDSLNAVSHMTAAIDNRGCQGDAVISSV